MWPEDAFVVVNDVPRPCFTSPTDSDIGRMILDIQNMDGCLCPECGQDTSRPNTYVKVAVLALPDIDGWVFVCVWECEGVRERKKAREGTRERQREKEREKERERKRERERENHSRFAWKERYFVDLELQTRENFFHYDILRLNKETVQFNIEGITK